MKKIISLLLVLMMVFGAVNAFAESAEEEELEARRILSQFLDETDLNTKDIALQVKEGDDANELVIRVEGDSFHLVAHSTGVEDSHIQLNPTGIYLKTGDGVTLLRYATVATIVQNFVKELEGLLDTVIQSIPEDQLPSQNELMEALNQLGILAAVEEKQAQADAVTLSSAAIDFAGKFKPENILDVKEEADRVEISLRSEAYASALAEAMDEMMSNTDLAALVNRQAAKNGGDTFAAIQKDWLTNREAILKEIRTIQSTESIDENGHIQSHFQIGEEPSESKILICDTDAWIDALENEVEIKITVRLKDEDPLLAYELALNSDYYNEKTISGNSATEVMVTFDEDGRADKASVLTLIDGKEELKANFGPDYLYIKGPKGAISTTVRETWTGKTRYELIVETAEGQEARIFFDLYQDGDSLVFEISDNDSDGSVQFRISRIDKQNIEDLSASEKIDEITIEEINAGLESILNLFNGESK